VDAGYGVQEIGNALFLSDVNINMVQDLKTRIKAKIDLDALGGINTRKYIQKVVFDELCALLDPGVPIKEFKKKKQNVLMLVGLCHPLFSSLLFSSLFFSALLFSSRSALLDLLSSSLIECPQVCKETERPRRSQNWPCITSERDS